MHFEIYPQPAGIIASLGKASPTQWRWRLKADNNKIVASGEAYHDRRDCEHAIDLLKSTDANTPVREVSS